MHLEEENERGLEGGEGHAGELDHSLSLDLNVVFEGGGVGVEAGLDVKIEGVRVRDNEFEIVLREDTRVVLDVERG